MLLGGFCGPRENKLNAVSSSYSHFLPSVGVHIARNGLGAVEDLAGCQGLLGSQQAAQGYILVHPHHRSEGHHKHRSCGALFYLEGTFRVNKRPAASWVRNHTAWFTGQRLPGPALPRKCGSRRSPHHTLRTMPVFPWAMRTHAFRLSSFPQ